MSFYSLSSYSQLRVNQGALDGGGTPSFSNVNSFSFDGVDDYFIGTSTYSELDGQNKATISFWAKFDHFSNARILTSVTRDSNLNNFVFMLCNVGNSLRFFTSSTSEYTYSNAVLTANAWLHIMIAIDKTQGSSATRCKIFINGQDETSSIVNQSASALQTSNSSLYIGENQNGKYSPFLGNIDEFAIWSGTDLRNDVATIYNNGIPTDLNDNGLTAPTTWQRMGEDATWNGATWTMTDVNGGYTNRSINMVEANRTTDVPTASTFSNTQSIALDGVDDFVDIGNPNNLSTITSISISAWFKTTDTIGGLVIVGSDDNAQGRRYILRTHNSSGIKLRFFSFSSNSSFNDIIGTTNINDGQWHHVLAINNGTNLKIYVDGVLDNSNTNGNLINTTFATPDINIGRRSYSGIEGYFDGSIDEVAIWSSDQSANASDIGGTIPTDLSTYNPLGWWRCGDGDTAPILSDNGSGGNDGTMTNFSTFSTDVPT